MKHSMRLTAAVLAVGGLLGWLAASGRMGEDVRPGDESRSAVQADGTQLPKPDPAFKGKIGETYKDSTPSYPLPVKAAEGQPQRAADPAG